MYFGVPSGAVIGAWERRCPLTLTSIGTRADSHQIESCRSGPQIIHIVRHNVRGYQFNIETSLSADHAALRRVSKKSYSFPLQDLHSIDERVYFWIGVIPA